jgi:hypothetical protein
MTMRFVLAPSVAVALLSTAVNGVQAGCPQDFASVGRLEASGAPGRPVHVHAQQPMPELYSAAGVFQVDLNYHQRVLPQVASGLHSDLTPAQVPAGFHISPAGEGRWSVSRPEWKPAKAAAPDTLANGTFSMWLRCEPAGGTCRVSVDICAKARPSKPKPLFPASSLR